MLDAGLEADYVYEIVYGVSANPRSWWDNSNAERLGYAPQDSAEPYAEEVKGKVAGNPVADQLHHHPVDVAHGNDDAAAEQFVARRPQHPQRL